MPAQGGDNHCAADQRRSPRILSQHPPDQKGAGGGLQQQKQRRMASQVRLERCRLRKKRLISAANSGTRAMITSTLAAVVCIKLRIKVQPMVASKKAISMPSQPSFRPSKLWLRKQPSRATKPKTVPAKIPLQNNKSQSSRPAILISSASGIITNTPHTASNNPLA